MTVQQAWQQAIKQLNISPSPILDAEVLLAYCLKTNVTKISTHQTTKLNLWQKIKWVYFLNLRKKGWPIAYLVKNKEFYGLNFYLNKHVLVPRPDSELLVEQTLKKITNRPDIKTIIDLGTGSGCLAIALASNLPNNKIIATDLSKKALKVARQNALNHQLTNLSFYQGDKLKPIKKILTSKNLPYLIVTNPPYLSNQTYSLALKKEPYLALWGGPDGLTWYKDFFNQLTSWTNTYWPDYLIMEISPELIAPLKLLNKTLVKPYQIDIQKDLNQKDRLITFSK
ncbi:peptide chain release factor N(5)-glutamine methyltransferase [Patescibacteria group bacterium]|nr:peptide chain release factor N(5)-glutamine methyltransferase [Patescibacteria group bacterium]